MVWPIPAGPAIPAPTVAPVKRRRHESQGDGAPVIVDCCGMLPQKRARGDKPNGVLKAARSAPRTRHKPATRTPKQTTNSDPKEAGRGAGRLAIPDSQGIHHRSLLGPSLQQGWAVEAADGQLIWVEGSVDEMAHRTDNTVLQQQQKEEVQQECFETSRRGTRRYSWRRKVRGAVREIKCRYCPDTKFKKWSEFKRHCDHTETHLLTIYFCKDCGGHFARSDACQRHCKNRPPQCLRETPEEADAKCRATQRAHDEFIGRLEGHLTTGEDIGTPFTKTIKALL